MDDVDFLALIEVLTAELTAIGAADIADERHYVETDAFAGDARLLGPRDRLIEMLKAFDRYLNVQDGALASRSLQSLNQSLGGRGPRRVLIEFAQGEREVIDQIDLEGTPELLAIRRDLQAFILRIIDPGSDPLASAIKVQ